MAFFDSKMCWPISSTKLLLLTCKVVFTVSIGVINIRQSPADNDAAPVFAAIGKS